MSTENRSLAATNRQDFLDPALWRRFDMQISIDLPSADERFAIIKRYAAPFDPPDEDVDILVGLTSGASPALLRALMEGVKRTLIVGPKTGREVNDAAVVFATVVADVAPAPEYEPPPLWADGLNALVAALSDFTWPMPKGETS